MHLYDMTPYDGAQPGWHRTLAQAHADAKLAATPGSVVIMLRDYPNGQQAFCDLFNGIKPDGKALRRWRLTPRRGLQEVTLEGEPLEGPVEPVPERAMAAPPPTEPPDQFWARLTKKEKP